jgi:2-polyprenyl-3-methyl-5-hydroxy-6-metoxy-1,4-benzoquinol methylase
VLDIGSGEGDFWQELQGKYDVVGMDLKETRFVKHTLNVERDSLRKIGERFRYVTMFDVIEHLENPVEALRNIRSIVEKGGLFIGSTPNRFDPYLFFGASIHSEHNYVFDKLTIEHLLRKCGFKPITVRSRVLPIILPGHVFLSADISRAIPTGRVVFWVAGLEDG